MMEHWLIQEKEDRARMDDILAKFNAILDRYDMPKKEDWSAIIELIWYGENEGVLDIELEGLEYIDWEELIHLIELLESSKGLIRVKGNVEVNLNNDSLKRYLLLSLHRLLYLSTGMYKASDNEVQEGKFKLMRLGKTCELNIKEPLEGVDSGFIEPFSPEELDKLLKIQLGIKRHIQRLKGEGRGEGKYIPYLGIRVSEVLDLMPERVYLEKKKTDILNFAGDILQLAGNLSSEPKWAELTKKYDRVKKTGWGDLSAIRKERQKKVLYWLKRGKEVSCKGENTQFCEKDVCDWYSQCKGKIAKYLDLKLIQDCDIITG